VLAVVDSPVRVGRWVVTGVDVDVVCWTAGVVGVGVVVGC
jgi:hypothetical protein